MQRTQIQTYIFNISGFTFLSLQGKAGSMSTHRGYQQFTCSQPTPTHCPPCLQNTLDSRALCLYPAKDLSIHFAFSCPTAVSPFTSGNMLSQDKALCAGTVMSTLGGDPTILSTPLQMLVYEPRGLSLWPLKIRAAGLARLLLQPYVTQFRQGLVRCL